MKVLIVDDDLTKVREIVRVLNGTGISDEHIDTAGCAAEAIRLLKEHEYGLLILDLYLPLRLADEPTETGGTTLLKQFGRDSELNRPEHIVGLTVSEEALSKAQPEFNRGLWSIVRFGAGQTEWKEALIEKAQYLIARDSVRNKNLVHETDILFVCALPQPELSQLKVALGGALREFTLDGDHTRYFQKDIPLKNGTKISVTACSAPSMGLTAAATLTTKACLQFRPKVVVMSGICAGRKGEVKIGDCIVASTSWDYGSGKFVGSNGDVKFKANPYQLPIDPSAQAAGEAVLSDRTMLDTIADSFQGSKPEQRLKVVLAPLASGAAVQANGEFFESLADQQVRKVAGIDMEAFAVCWAAREAIQPMPYCVIAKSVADYADEEKADGFQEYCSFTSALVGLEIAKRLIE